MARAKTSKVAKGIEINDFFGELVKDLEFEFAGDDSAKSIIDFLDREVDIEAWLGPGGKLNDRQIAILKVYDGIPLDEKEKGLMQAWGALDRTTYDLGLPASKRQSFVLECGRSGGKCSSQQSSFVLGTGHKYGYELLNSILGKDYFYKGQPPQESQDIAQQLGIIGKDFPFKETVALEGKSKKAKAGRFFVKGLTETKKAITKAGYHIEGTPEHRIKVMTAEGNIDWKYLGDIEVGDQVAIHRNTGLFPKGYVSTGHWSASAKHQNSNNQKEFSPPGHIDADWGYLIGLMVADGLWTQPNRLSISCHDLDLDGVCKAFNDCGFTVATGTDKRSQHGCFATHYGREAREFFDYLGYSLEAKPRTKQTPWVIRQSPKDVQASYLSGLFDGDGCIYPNGRNLSFSSASITLVQETQLLLLNFGIVSSITTSTVNEEEYYQLTLLGRDSLKRFAEQIGLRVERRASKLANYLAKPPSKKSTSQTDSIPNQIEWLQRLRNSLPNNMGEQPGSRQALTSYKGGHAEQLRNVRTEYRAMVGNAIKKSSGEQLNSNRVVSFLPLVKEYSRDPEAVRHFQHLLDCDYYYTPVVSVEDSEAFCVDLWVPGHEQYVCQGMTNHNTFLGAIIIGYEFYKLCMLPNPQQFFGVAATTLISIYCLAPAASQVKKTIFGQAKAFLNYIPKVKRLIDNKSITVGEEQIKYDEKLLYIYAGNSKGSSQVGSRVILLVMDEVARFENKDGESNALELWSNVGVSGITFGEHARRLAVSSAWNEGDAIQRLYTAAKGDQSWIGFRLRTWDLNPTMTRDNPIIASEYNLNPISARLEFEGDRTANTYGFFSEMELLNAFTGYSQVDIQRVPLDDDNLVKLRLNNVEPYNGQTYMHLDPAFTQDAYGLAFGHGEMRNGEKVVIIDGLAAWEPDGGSVVSIMNVYDIIFGIHALRPIYKVTTDHAQQHETIQRLRMGGISSSSRFWSNRVQVEIYDFTRKLFHEKRIILPKNSPWTALLKAEMTGISHDKERGKIMHGDAGKDIIDCVCSVAWEIAGAASMQNSIPRLIQSKSVVSSRYNNSKAMKDDEFSSGGRRKLVRQARHADSRLFDEFDF